MNTVLATANTRSNGQAPGPTHPVDAALWGLAERLAGGAAADAEVVANGATVDVPSERSPQIRVVGLPQRGAGLPSVGRMTQRKRVEDNHQRGVPTKPAGLGGDASPRKTQRTSRSQDAAPDAQSADVKAPRAEFTILKNRRGDAPGLDEQVQGASGKRQDCLRRGESPVEQKKPRRERRAKPGVTIYGWLFLSAAAVVAAAIALFAPAWF